MEKQSYRDVAAGRYVHEMTCLKHVTGASEPEIRNAMEKFGNNRSRIERELRRVKLGYARESAA